MIVARDDKSKRKGARTAAAPSPASFAETPDPIPHDAALIRAIELFRQFPTSRFLAVVDGAGRPIGAVHERLVRDLLFTPYGHSLLANPGCRWTLAQFTRPCPAVDEGATLEVMIAAHDHDQTEGLILTRRGRYAALLPSRALLQLAAARERTLQATKLADADAAIARAAALERAFASFRADAARFGEALGRAAGEIRASAGGVAERAVQNREQATALAAASTQSAGGIAEVAESSTQLADQGKLIEHRVAEAKAAVEQAVGHVALGAAKARSLKSAADAIGGIVAVIAEIAAKVNMLAINATIEAVRAGPAGRTFAVVAGEVKSLAGQAGHAASEIEGQVKAMRAAVADSAGANAAIEEIVGELQGIAADIRESVVEQSAATNLIARNVEHCALASAEISAHVAEMGGRVASAGQMAVQLEGVALRLGAQAGELSARVDGFLDELRAA